MIKDNIMSGHSSAVTRILLTCCLLFQLRQAHGILPTAAIDVRLSDGTVYTLLVSQASFGAAPEMLAKSNEVNILQLAPAENPLLCQNVTSPAFASSLEGITLMVPRGVCTFEQKASNAQLLGAKAILIYGTLESRYLLNETKYINQTDHTYTADDIVYPQKYYDYDCDKGRAEIPASDIQLEPLPYNAEHNDPILSGSSSSNLCKINSADSLRSCPSEACLLTGNKSESGMMEACCAWDLHVWLYSDPKVAHNSVSIPAAYLTMDEASKVLRDLQQQQVRVVLYARYRFPYNPSSLLIWALGVTVAALAAYLSASDYRSYMKGAIARTNNSSSMLNDYATEDAVVTESPIHGSVRSRSHSPSAQRSLDPMPMDSEAALSSNGPAARLSAPTMAYPIDSLELNAGHALGFVVMASSGLLILFFFKIYSVVKIFYAFGCSKAIAQVIFFPLCTHLARRFYFSDRIVLRTNTEDFGDITLLDVVSFAFGYAWGLLWLFVAFFLRHPENITFYWVTQDVMGSCMCIMFLSVIKLNSIRVATLLLLVAFFYDIFFVFVTPLIFKGESVMITVATSGGPPKADPSWCEKYPSDKDCQGGDPLPMLLTVPRIGDYQGGSSLLGLGDIVLPGLLLSFAARLDAAKSMLGVVGGGNGALNSYSCPEQKFCGGCSFCSGGYFAPLVLAYGVGLLMANIAVYVMNMGQPALLYLVPSCLGTMAFMGWRRKELRGLWDGPKTVRSADTLIYGEMENTDEVTTSSHVPLEDSNSIGSSTEPSPAQENEGGVPLLLHQKV